MAELPPDFLILQSHSHHVADYIDLYCKLAAIFELRIHVSIESDRDELPGLPPSASSVEKRIAAAGSLKSAGLRAVVTVSPLLPIDDPERFFHRLSEVADAVVIDHFIEGDGSPTGKHGRSAPAPADRDASGLTRAVGYAGISRENRRNRTPVFLGENRH